MQTLQLTTTRIRADGILPRASDLWVQASLDYKQRLQQLFFPEGIAYDGNRFNRTAVTAPLFKYLAPSESAHEKMVSRVGIEPTTRRLRDSAQSQPIRVDLSKTGSALPHLGRWRSVEAACFGYGCTLVAHGRRRAPIPRAIDFIGFTGDSEDNRPRCPIPSRNGNGIPIALNFSYDPRPACRAGRSVQVETLPNHLRFG
jgi:hypothetical protein